MGNASPTKTVFSSTMTEALPVQQQILEAARVEGFPKQVVFAIRLALDEALANAVKHGNKSDPDKTVSVEYVIDIEKLIVTICDQGPGFNPNDLDDPTSDENLTRPHGRGVMLMQAYMTEVHFNDSGNCVTLVKRKDCPLPHRD